MFDAVWKHSTFYLGYDARRIGPLGKSAACVTIPTVMFVAADQLHKALCPRANELIRI